eukprot:TRINITY_DN50465_c0_g1_i1.p1 TRINITY_DN50465_c0_g1~~TRINITY_DN50465_c0_g1_i1.p1  ORF type:complete len:240 (-),score=53.28 TRINITY_DN50465_c0_g1_i1:761-1480(-)
MLRRPPRSTLSSSSAASDVYKRQEYGGLASSPHLRRTIRRHEREMVALVTRVPRDPVDLMSSVNGLDSPGLLPTWQEMQHSMARPECCRCASAMVPYRIHFEQAVWLCAAEECSSSIDAEDPLIVDLQMPKVMIERFKSSVKPKRKRACKSHGSSKKQQRSVSVSGDATDKTSSTNILSLSTEAPFPLLQEAGGSEDRSSLDALLDSIPEDDELADSSMEDWLFSDQPQHQSPESNTID